MKHITTSTEWFYVRSMGKALRVTAIFTDDDSANAYMAKHSNQAVVCCLGPFILLADKYDKGITIPKEKALDQA